MSLPGPDTINGLNARLKLLKKHFLLGIACNERGDRENIFWPYIFWASFHTIFSFLYNSNASSLVFMIIWINYYMAVSITKSSYSICQYPSVKPKYGLAWTKKDICHRSWQETIWGIFSKNQFHVSRGHSLKTEILNYLVLINLNFKGQMPIHNQFWWFGHQLVGFTWPFQPYLRIFDFVSPGDILR